MAGSRTLKLNILADTKDLVDGLNKANSEVNTAGSKIGDTFKKVGVAVAAAAAAVGAFAVKFGVDAIKAASDLNEEIDKARVVFGDAASEIEKFGDTAATAIGQSKTQAIAAASNFAIFGKAAGLAGKDLVDFSTDFTVLASDLASFSNTSPDQAITALGAALRGETEPIRSYGVLLDDATLRQAALELGIVSTTKNALTPQQRVLAAQAEIFKQTAIQQGNFADTSGSLANQQRILAAQIETVKTNIGTALLPVVVELFTFLNTKLTPSIEKWADSFSTNVAPIIDRVFKIVQRDLLPVLQVLGNFILKDLVPTIRDFFKPVIDILITGIQFLINKVKENEQGFSVFLGIIQRVWQFIKDYVIPLFQTAFVTAINLVFRAIGFLIEAFTQVFEIIGKVAKFLGFDLDLALNKTTKSTNNLNSGIVDAYKSFAEQSKVVKDSVIPSLDGATGSTNALTAATNNAASATKNLSALQRELSALQAGGALPATISKDLKSFYRSELSLISQAGGFIEGINLLPTDPFYGFGKGGNVSQAIQQRQSGSATATGGTVIINVNGTVVDPEGAARAIENVINNSIDRGGNYFPGIGAGLIAE